MSVTREELRDLKPLVVAVVGPTNEGKTSLLRTLTGDPNFGLVNAFNGTTVRVEIQKVFYDGIAEILRLVDTPGFQMSGSILEALAEDAVVEERGGAFGIEDVLRVIPEKDDDYRHDRLAWNEVARCDVVIFVANVVDDPNQSLIKHTLGILKNVGKPVVVAYNNLKPAAEKKKSGGFAAVSDFRKDWNAILQENGFYLIQNYDAHWRSFRDEIDLFEKIAACVCDSLQRKFLRREIKARQTREARRLDDSRRIVADLLLDVAGYQELETNVAYEEMKTRREKMSDALNKKTIKREHQAHLKLLETWGFRSGVLDREPLNVDNVSKEKEQILNGEAQRRLKSGVGGGAAAGASIGAIFDLATGGLSLGVGTAIGAAIGGLLGGGGVVCYYYDSKEKTLTVQLDENSVSVVTSRAVDLIKKLQTRGKALDESVQTLVSAKQTLVNLPGVKEELEPRTRVRKTRSESIERIAELLKKAIPDDE